jgi:ADP-ribose pyrophosphatase
MIKKLDTKLVYTNPWMTVREDHVQFADGSRGIYGVVEKPDFALIIPKENDNFYLVKNYRYTVSNWFWEFPQGSNQRVNDDMSVLALAELEEETGLKARSVSQIGHLYEAYGYSNQGFDVFLAENFTKTTQNLEASEAGMEVRKFSQAELERMIENGEVKDAPTIAAYGLLRIKRPA